MTNHNQTKAKAKTNILRWLIFLPLAFLVASIGNLFLGLVLVGVGIQNQTVLDGVSAFVFSFLLVFLAGVFAPSKQTRVAIVVSGGLVFLVILGFIFAILRIEIFTEPTILDRLYILALQILGILYALFLVPPLTVPGTTLERFWREIISLGTIVTMFGGVFSVAGLIIGVITRTWTVLAAGIVILVMGILTWLFPYSHLLMRLRNLKKDI